MPAETTKKSCTRIAVMSRRPLLCTAGVPAASFGRQIDRDNGTVSYGDHCRLLFGDRDRRETAVE